MSKREGKRQSLISEFLSDRTKNHKPHTKPTPTIIPMQPNLILAQNPISTSTKTESQLHPKIFSTQIKTPSSTKSALCVMATYFHCEPIQKVLFQPHQPLEQLFRTLYCQDHTLYLQWQRTSLELPIHE